MQEKPKEKYMLSVRVYKAVETCIVEFPTKMALDFAIAEIKTKYADISEVVEAIKVKDTQADY